ncbi:MAG: hypothetical protein KAH38_04485 [Candidatus Hydrogenedentes bacterium]|nr:hypothetical protein [Candidatus Hydrogenedentota bacterium]
MSSFRKRARAKRADLEKRVRESIAAASGFPSVIDLEKGTKLGGRPIKMWAPKEGHHTIDILPFFAGKHHEKAEGEFVHHRDFHAHYNIGPTEEPYICNAKTKINGKPVGPCPVCEYLSKHDIKNTDEVLWNKIRPRHRCLYFVWVHDTNAEEEAGAQILDIAHWFMEQKLTEIASNPRTGGVVVFQDLDKGKSIMFQKSGAGISTKVVGHRFDDRPEPIPEEMDDQIFPLDEVLKFDTSYKDLRELFFQGIVEEEEGEEELEELEDIPYGSEDEDEPPFEDEEEPEEEDEPPFEDEEEPEEEPEPAPKKRRKKRPVAEDPAPAPPSKRPARRSRRT